MVQPFGAAIFRKRFLFIGYHNLKINSTLKENNAENRVFLSLLFLISLFLILLENVSFPN